MKRLGGSENIITIILFVFRTCSTQLTFKFENKNFGHVVCISRHSECWQYCRELTARPVSQSCQRSGRTWACVDPRVQVKFDTRCRWCDDFKSSRTTEINFQHQSSSVGAKVQPMFQDKLNTDWTMRGQWSVVRNWVSSSRASLLLIADGRNNKHCKWQLPPGLSSPCHVLIFS